jgi:hypothetical protein
MPAPLRLRQVYVRSFRASRSVEGLPAEKRYVAVPPPGVMNWVKLTSPEPIEGGEKVTVRARWQCLERGQWRSMYSDGSYGRPVTAQGPWTLQRGPGEVFHFQTQEPQNPSLIGEVLTLDMDMEVMEGADQRD